MTDLQKSYNPAEIDDSWYALWETRGYFEPDEGAPLPPYCIVIPPPNVTGSLHMGHALNVTIQDILVRWKRMLGHKVLWIPGTDHAGIATQNVVERELAKEGLDRYRLGRDAFMERVWKWKSEYGGRILHQLKKLGASCDWSKERFTLDEGLSKAVKEVFVRLFEEELIYRDSRLINWCPRCHTALSDLEVEYEEREGKLFYIRYPVTGDDKYVTVATTRPETMLGDTAVAVHPNDTRYKTLINKTVDLPLTGRRIPIIVDTSVDPEFGSGAVKVTPAHDFNDEIIGRRHDLPFINVMTEDGLMSIEAGHRYFGLDRYDCRKQVVEDLKELDLFEGEKKHNHAVGHCYRCKTTIEPFLTIQWYVKIQPLAVEAVKVVEDGEIRIIPEVWENNYFAWMKNINDWCISRQIWWGHQIPVWYCPDCQGPGGVQQGEMIEHVLFEPIDLGDANNRKLLSGGTYAELRRLGLSHGEIISRSKMIRVSKDVTPLCQREELNQCPACGGMALIRDPDVLDTWFSSALWPFSTLGWPDNTADLKTFYPTTVLVTGFDILFFWVARMIMMGLKVMGNVPFKDVYIHALVRDLKGKKMSKSKGNVVDPLVIIEKYGADAFRFTLAAFAAQGRDVRFSEDRVEGYRYFINKLWNATKFMMNYKEFWTKGSIPSSDRDLDLAGQWIMSRLASTVEDVNTHLTEYRFNDAASSVYQFVWHEFCDWYIEIVKQVLYQGSDDEKKDVVNCLFFVLKNVLQILHPFMPFVTEEIWSKLFDSEHSIMSSPFPANLARFYEAERKMGYLMDTISGIRSIRGELNIPPSLEINVDVKTVSEEVGLVLKNNLDALKKLSRCKEISVGSEVKRKTGSAVSVKDNMEIYIPIGGLLDIESELRRLQKEKLRIDEGLSAIQKKLLNEDFLKSAPEDIVSKEKARFSELLEKAEKMEGNMALLRTIKN